MKRWNGHSTETACAPTGARVLRHVLGTLGALRLPREAEADLVAALQADPRGSTELALLACRDGRLDLGTSVRRTAACMLLFAAGNLADDLADGDCTYLESPGAVGPGAAVMLLSLAWAEAARGHVSPAGLAEACEHIVRAAAAQQVEVRTDDWTLGRSLEVAEGVAGHQLAAYLRLCWDGTPLEGQAETVGLLLGVATNVALDLRSRDPRVMVLHPEERRALVERARKGLGALESLDLETVRGLAPQLFRVLSSA